LRYAAVRLGLGLATIALAAFLAVIGFALCLWAIYQYLMTATDAATASLLTGLLSIILVGVLIWLANRLNR
jgi:hypothetical protein